MYACVFVPHFALQAAIRVQGEECKCALAHTPAVIVDGPENMPRVVDLNDAAHNAGVRIGMTKLQVEVCRGIWMQTRSIENEDAAQTALIQCAQSFSPRVESTSSGTVLFDLSGTKKLFGSLNEVSTRIKISASEMGFDVQFAIASDPDTAMYAARGFEGPTIIPKGEEAKTLALIPVHILSTDQETLDDLESWGIRNFAELAALPVIPLSERLGQEGLYLQRLAQGKVVRPLRPLDSSIRFVSSFEFENPVETLESISFILNRLLQEIFSRLIERSLATNEIHLTLDLEVRQRLDGKNGEQFVKEWKLPDPTQDRDMLCKLISLDLEGITFLSPIKQLTIEAFPIKPQVVQGNLFAPPSPEPGKMEIGHVRIRNILGVTDENGIACAGLPRRLDTHKAGGFTVQPFSITNKITTALPAPISLGALRFFRPPVKTNVKFEHHEPALVELWRAHRKVLRATGPFCTSGNWWDGSKWAWSEWDVEVRIKQASGRFRIGFEAIEKQWYLKGSFD